MKRSVAAVVAVGLWLAACGPQSAESVDQDRVNNQQAHYATVQPVPFFDFSMDRDTLIQIYKAKNEARQTHSVVMSQGTGAVLWDCPSIGFPLPADAQLTNPLQAHRYATGWSGAVIEQAEPNGVFSSKNTDATYIQCVGPDGDVSPVYTEQKVTTFPFPVTISPDGRIERAGASTIVLDINPGTEGVAPAASPAQ